MRWVLGFVCAFSLLPTRPMDARAQGGERTAMEPRSEPRVPSAGTEEANEHDAGKEYGPERWHVDPVTIMYPRGAPAGTHDGTNRYGLDYTTPRSVRVDHAER